MIPTGVRIVLDDVGAHAHEALAAIDPELGELCRTRAAALIGLDVEPRRPLTPLQNACVALADQMVLDVTGVTDRLIDDVVAHLGRDGTATFVHAALAIEQRLRMGALWERLDLGGAA